MENRQSSPLHCLCGLVPGNGSCVSGMRSLEVGFPPLQFCFLEKFLVSFLFYFLAVTFHNGELSFRAGSCISVLRLLDFLWIKHWRH